MYLFLCINDAMSMFIKQAYDLDIIFDGIKDTC